MTHSVQKARHPCMLRKKVSSIENSGLVFGTIYPFTRASNKKIMWVPRRAASIRLASHRRLITGGPSTRLLTISGKSVRKLCSRLQIHASLGGESRRASKRSASTWRTRFRTVSPKNGRNYPARGHLSPATMLQKTLSASKGCVTAWINPVTDPLHCAGAVALRPWHQVYDKGLETALGPRHWGQVNFQKMNIFKI